MNAKKLGKNAGRVVLRLVWPGTAIKNTIELTKKTQEHHRSNITLIKSMYQGIKDNIEPPPINENSKELSFDEVINNREPASLSIPELYRHFLLKKRMALGMGVFFIGMGIYSLVNGNWLGLAPLLASPPVFLMLALSAQLRLWQLRTRRLSQAENGGLRDFLAEIRGWWWEVLNPELVLRKGVRS